MTKESKYNYGKFIKKSGYIEALKYALAEEEDSMIWFHETYIKKINYQKFLKCINWEGTLVYGIKQAIEKYLIEHKKLRKTK